MATIYGHHRTPWFEGILQDIAARLRLSFGDSYTPLFLTCTGLGAREAAVANLVRPGDFVLATEGDFTRLAQTWGADVETLPSSPKTQRPPDAVLIEHVSASGAVHDISTIVQQVRAVAPDAAVVLDASISFGVDFVDVTHSGADAVIVVPEHALMGIPGVSVFAVTNRFIKIVEERRQGLAEQPFLFDLLRYQKTWKKHTTPYSPNISACVAMQAALDYIDTEGGLESLPERHRQRAERVRRRAIDQGHQLLTVEGTATNAFTPLALADGVDVEQAVRDFAEAGIEARQVGPSSLLLAHVGYDPARTVAPAPLEPPFTIAPAEFIEQVGRLVSRSTLDEPLRERILKSAVRVFQDQHQVHQDAIRHRTVGFVGAGRIVNRAVDLCRAVGIDHLKVYSPSLAQGAGTRAWTDRGVEVCRSLEELFTTCHTIVLLPVVYDERALGLFRKPAQYFNRGLVSRALLEKAEAAGRLDLIVNAAARGALVDRPALAAAVNNGWLRYFSDEMPPAGDPLMGNDDVHYTAHVGGSCRAPQAAVARNTHTILRQLIAGMRGTRDSSTEYTLSVVNSHLITGAVEQESSAAARDLAAGGPLRVLLTDPFDVESMAFGRLEEDFGIATDVHDVSAGPMSNERLIAAVERVRPHILMLRSRTKIDAAAARALAAIDDLGYVIRPGVGVDNLYDGMEILSERGIQIINEPYGNSGAVAEMALHFILTGTESTIFAPGPTKFHPHVFDVADAYDTSRASAVDVSTTISQDLAAWLGSRKNAVVISGPGTALMESSIASLTMPGSRGLVISHGKFGDRFVEIARARGRSCEVLQVPEDQWGAAITPERVRHFLEEDRQAGHPPISFLCFQQNETSSGVTYHQESIRAIARAVRSYNAEITVIVDAISGALAHRLDFDTLDIDILFLGSQKALGVSSGLAYGVVSDRAIQWMVARAGYHGELPSLSADRAVDTYLDAFDRLQHVHAVGLLRALVALHRGQLVDTPSVFHLLSTARALELFRAEGGREVVAHRHSALARLVRQGVGELGLRVMPSAPYESDSVTVVILPTGLDAGAIRKSIARNTGIAVAGAQGDYWKPRMLRIGTLGFTTRADVVRCLRAVRQALAEAGYTPAPDARVVSAF